MGVTLYADMMSQPSRACIIFCAVNNIPVQIELVRLDKGGHRTKSYLAVNPLGKVPTLVDTEALGEQALPESSAILCYLAQKHHVPSHWYPDPASQGLAAHARFNAALNWQHTSVRVGCTRLVFHSVLGKIMGVPVSPEVALHGAAVLKEALGALERYWLADRPFMTGQQVSIPDLLCACELEQLRMLVAVPTAPQREQLLAPYPKVRTWVGAVREATNPHYDEACKTLMAAVRRATPKPKL